MTALLVTITVLLVLVRSAQRPHRRPDARHRVNRTRLAAAAGLAVRGVGVLFAGGVLLLVGSPGASASDLPGDLAAAEAARRNAETADVAAGSGTAPTGSANAGASPVVPGVDEQRTVPAAGADTMVSANAEPAGSDPGPESGAVATGGTAQGPAVVVAGDSASADGTATAPADAAASTDTAPPAATAGTASAVAGSVDSAAVTQVPAGPGQAGDASGTVAGPGRAADPTIGGSTTTVSDRSPAAQAAATDPTPTGTGVWTTSDRSPAAPAGTPSPTSTGSDASTVANSGVVASVWSPAWSGAQTLSSDGTTVTLAPDSATGQAVSRLLALIKDILIVGDPAGGNALTIAGPIGRAVIVRGSGSDRLVLPPGPGTLNLAGTAAGVLHPTGAAAGITFTGIADLDTGAGPTTVRVDGAATLGSLQLHDDDTLLIQGPQALLTVGRIALAGTLQFADVDAGTVDRAFLTFGRATGDFAVFRGLDLGGGRYLRPEVTTGGYRVATASLPGGITVGSARPDLTDDLYAMLSGTTIAGAGSGTITIGTADATLTGEATLAPATGPAGAPGVDIRFVGGTLTVLGLTLAGLAGTIRLTTDGLSGSLSSAKGGQAVDGLLGTVAATVTVGGTAGTPVDPSGASAGTATAGARGPPWRIRLTDPRPALALALGSTHGHTVTVDTSTIGTATTDLVVTVDDIEIRRKIAGLTDLTITATGTTADQLYLRVVIPGIAIAFHAGAGADSITGPAADTVWHVTGPGSGRMQNLAFTGVEHLIGAAGNEDEFVLDATGTIGSVDGGAGGFDTLRFTGTPTTGALTYLPDGLQSGDVLVGDRRVRFEGLEPVSSTVTAPVVTLTYIDPADELVLTATSSTQLKLTSTRAETIDFALPGQSLTINAGGAKVTLRGTLNLVGATLAITGASALTVDGALTAGTVALAATASASVTKGSSITASGDLSIAVDAAVALTWSSVNPFFRDIAATGALTVDAAALRGRNISLTVRANTTKYAEFEIDQSKTVSGLIVAMTPGARPTFVDGGTEANGTPRKGSITRAEGSWVADGFAAGTTILVTNTKSNNGFLRIIAVSATTLTIDPATRVHAEAGSSEVQIRTAVPMTGNPALTFAGSTVTRAGGSWLDDGFKVGKNVRITGTSGAGPLTTDGPNDGEGAVTAVTATVLTLDSGIRFAARSGVLGVTVWAHGSPADIPLVVVDPAVSVRPADIGLVFTHAQDGASTITRQDGKTWAADGFAAGQTIVVDGPSRNQGSWVVGKTVGSVLTLLAAADVVTETVRGVEILGVAVPATAPGSENPVPVVKFRSADSTITRADAISWATQGFVVGQYLTVADTAGNNGSYRITAITGGTLTVAAADGTTAVLRDEDTGANATDPVLGAVVSLLRPTLVFTGQTVTRSRGSWTADGFTAGDRIRIAGTTVNTGLYQIKSISADGAALTLTLNAGDTLRPDAVFDVSVARLLPTSSTVRDAGLSLSAPIPALSVAESLIGFLAQAVRQDTTAAVSVATGATVTATGSLTVTATAISVLTLSTQSIWLGGTYGRSSAVATVDVGAAQLRATGDVLIATAVNNTAKIATTVNTGVNMMAMAAGRLVGGTPGLIPGPVISVTVGDVVSTARTSIADGALVEGAAVGIHATVTNDVRVLSTSMIWGLKKANTGISVGVVVSLLDSDATVTVGGTVRATKDLAVTSSAINVNNDAQTFADIDASAFLIPKGVGYQQGAATLVGVDLDSTFDSSEFALGAAVTVAISSNDARTFINAGAVLSSRGSVAIGSAAEDNATTVAVGGAVLEQDPAMGGSIAKVALAGGVAIGSYANRAATEVSKNAIVTAAHRLAVTADAVLPSQLLNNELARAFGNGSAQPQVWPGTTADAQSGAAAGARPSVLTALLGLTSPYKIISQNIASSSVDAAAGGRKKNPDGTEADRSTFAISGAVIVLTIVNSATALVANNAIINNPAAATDPVFAVTAAADQSVAITASSRATTFHLAGLSKVQDLAELGLGGGTVGKTGVGGNYQQITLHSTADAHVADGARITARGSVEITAANRLVVVAFTQQGGDATKVGVSGAVTLLRLTTTASAYLEDTATVVAGGDLAVTATNQQVVVAVSAVLQRGGRVSVGDGVAVTIVTTSTRAFIGNQDEKPAARTAGAPATLDVSGRIAVRADSQVDAVTVGTAASTPSSVKPAPGGSATTGPLPAGASVATGSAGSAFGQNSGAVYGFGLSAQIAINVVGNTTRAFIDVPGAVRSGAALTVQAASRVDATAVAAAVLVRPQSTSSLTLAGAFAWNELSNQVFGDPSTADRRSTTFAWLSAPTVGASTVTVQSRSTDRPTTVALSVGALLPQRADGGKPVTVNLAGSVSVNRIHTGTSASIGGSIGTNTTITTTGDLSVQALRDLRGYSVTGAVAVFGTVAAGAAIDVTLADDVVTATIGNGARVTAGGTVLVSAHADQSVVTVAAALAMLSDLIALPITINLQLLTAHVTASLGTDVVLSAGGHLAIDAVLRGASILIAGSGAFAGAGAGIGIAMGVAQLDHHSSATIGARSTVTQTGSPTATVPTVDGAAATGITVGAVTRDDVQVVAASGAGGRNPVNVALSPAVALATASAAAGADRAGLSGTAVTVTGRVTPTVSTLALAGAVAIRSGSGAGGAGGGGPPGVNNERAGLAVAGAAAGAVALLDLTATATISGSTVTSSGPVTVRATANGEITSDAGGIALALARADGSTVAATFGASYAVNEIRSAVTASVTGSTIILTGSSPTLQVLAGSDLDIGALTVTGTLAAGAGGPNAATSVSIAGAGAGSRNTIDADTGAAVTDSTVRTTGAVTIRATVAGAVTADAGGFAISLARSGAGKPPVHVAAGLSAALNQITGDTTADLTGSTVTASALTVQAVATTTIDALTMGGAAGSAAGSGAGSGNTIGTALSAVVDDSSVTAGSGAVRVIAHDASMITADAGGMAVAVQITGNAPGTVTLAAAIGASAAVNVIGNDVTARITDSTVTAGSVSVLATAVPAIRALALSGTAAVQSIGAGTGTLSTVLAGAGAGAGNAIDDRVTAGITGSGSVTATGDVTVHAAMPASDNDTAGGDGATIVARAVGVSFGLAVGSASVGLTVGIGAAVAVNHIGRGTRGNTITATVKAGVAGGSVAVLADATAGIDAIAAGVALALSASGTGTTASISVGGAVTDNSIAGTVTATVSGGAVCAGPSNAGTPTTCDGTVTVAAASTGTINAAAGAGAVSGGIGRGGSLALGVATATSTLTARVTASITGGATSVRGGTISVTATATGAVTTTAVAVSVALQLGWSGGTALSVTGAGAGSTVTVTDTATALIDGAAVTAGTGGLTVAASTGNPAGVRSTAAAAALALSVTGSGSPSIAATIAAATATAAASTTVRAGIENGAMVTDSGALTVSASTAGDVHAAVGAGSLTGSVGGSGPAFSVSIAVAVAQTTVSDDLRAAITGSASRVTARTIAVDARSARGVDTTSAAVAAGITVSGGWAQVTVSAAGAQANSTVAGAVAALVESAQITATGGDLGITARANLATVGTRPPAGTGAGHLSTLATAMSGAVTVTTGVGVSLTVAAGVAIADTRLSTTVSAAAVKADVCAGSRTGQNACTPNGAITVAAGDSAVLDTAAIGGALTVVVGQGGSLAVGVAQATNTVTARTTALVDASRVAGKAVDVTALSAISAAADAVAVTVTLSGASAGVSVGVGFGGATATNTVTATVSAQLIAAATVTATVGGVTVSATGLTTLDTNAAAGGLAAAASGAGVAVAATVEAATSTNTQRLAVTAAVLGGSTVDAADRVRVLATGDRWAPDVPRIRSTGAGVAVAVALTAPTLGVGLAAAGAGVVLSGVADDTIRALIGDTASTRVTARAATTGALTVSAVDRNAVDNEAVAAAIAGATGPAVAIGVVTITATLDAAVEALVRSAQLAATAGGVSIAADRTADARAEGTVAAVGLIGAAGAGVAARSRIGGTVTAWVTGSTITAQGAIAVTADTRSRSTARSDGGAGSALLAIGAATATAENAVAATAGFADAAGGTSGSTTTSTGLTVRATRTGLTEDGAAAGTTTVATTVLGAVGAVAQGTVVATATDSGAVRARIGDGHLVDARTGDVAVTATSTLGTRAAVHGTAIGATAITVSAVAATASGDTTAEVGTGMLTGRSLTVRATGTSAVTADAWTLGVALVGVAGGRATAESTGSVTASIGAAAGPAYGTVETTGAVAVLAQLRQAAAVDTRGGAAGLTLVGVGGLAARAVVAGSGTAFVGAGQKVRAGSLTVTVAGLDAGTPAVRTASATSVVGAVGLAAGAGSSSTALVTGSLDASVRDGATLTVTGALAVGATGAATADADARGGSGGALAISAFFADARIAAVDGAPRAGTRAWLGRNVVLTAGSLRVVADATDTATARLQAVAVTLVGGAGGDAAAVVDADVSAWIAGRSGTTGSISVSGAVDVLATGNRSTDATVDGGVGGLITAAWLNGTARTAGTVGAWLADGTDIASAAGLVVRAQVAGALARSSVVIGAVGKVSVTGLRSTATSTVQSRGWIGDDVTVGRAAPIAGDVEVAAVGRGEADATGTAYAGGGIVVGVPQATATVSPAAQTWIGTENRRTTVILAAGSIRVRAQLSKQGLPVTDQVRQIDPNSDRLTIDNPGLAEGLSVRWVGSSTPGLHDGHVYSVLGAGTGQIRLGSLIDPALVDPARETITFAGEHGFVSGDCVWYDARGSSSIIGSAGAATGACGAATPPEPGARAFYVRVLDATTIKLTTTRAAAVADSDAPLVLTPVDGTHVTVPAGSGLKAGDAVVYRAPVVLDFGSAVVDVALQTQPAADGSSVVGPGEHVTSANNIFLGPDQGLATGDAVRYTQLGAGGIGLTDGATYYVIKNADGQTIGLARSRCEAVGCEGGSVRRIELAVTGAESAQHRLERSLGSLVDGRTYYVSLLAAGAGPGSAGAVSASGVDGFGITLTAARGGSALALTATDRPGRHAIGLVEVDLVPAVAGAPAQSLFVDLTGACTGACGRLQAPDGGPLTAVAGSAGDGVSTAVAQGGTLAAAGVSAVTASVTGRVVVTTTVAGALVSAGRDVVIDAISEFDVGAAADTSNGGAIAVGAATGSADLGQSPTHLTITGTVVAAGDLTAAATTDHTLRAAARAGSAAILAGASIAYTRAAVDDDVIIRVADQAVLTTGRHLSVLVDANTVAATDSSSTSIAVGAGADADATNQSTRGVRIGTASDVAERVVRVGAGAQLTGATVAIRAMTGRLAATATAQARSASPILLGITTAYAAASIDVYVDTYVKIHGGTASAPTRITGLQGVDITALARNLSAVRDATVKSVSTIPPQQARLRGTDWFATDVNVDAGVLVTAGPRAPVPGGSLDTAPGVALSVTGTAAPVDRPEKTSGPSDKGADSYRRGGDIHWDADIVVYPGVASPTLVIGADGRVLAAIGVQVLDAAGSAVTPVVGQAVPLYQGAVVLAPIGVVTTPTVQLRADDVIANQAGGRTPGSTTARWPIVEFRSTLAGVSIVNHSAYALRVDRIDTVDRLSGTPQVLLVPAGGNASAFRSKVTLEFDVRRPANPTAVVIEQRGAGDLTLAGTIDNPVGLTRLVAMSGSIVGSGTVITNQVEVSAATGSVTLAASLIRYRYEAASLLGGPATAGDRPGRLVVDAGGSVTLTLRGIDRTGGPAGPITVPVEHIWAGVDVTVVLLRGLHQTPTAARPVNVLVQGELSYWGIARPHEAHVRGTGGFDTDPAAWDPGRTGRLDPTRVVNSAGNTVVDTVVRFGQASTVGLTAGGSISIKDEEAVADPLAADQGLAGRLDVIGYVRPGSAGRLDVGVDGLVEVHADAGDLLVGLVRSRTDDVALYATGAITDVGRMSAASVRGRSILLDAATVGTAGNFVETDLIDTIAGALSVNALYGAHIREVSGDLRVNWVFVTKSDPTAISDAVLVAAAGSIVNAPIAWAKVSANRIDLRAAGSIGTEQDPLRIDSSIQRWMSGRLVAYAGDGVYLTETDDELVILAVYALHGPVVLRTVDTNAPRSTPGAGVAGQQDEDILLVPTGRATLDDKGPTDFVRSGEPTGGSVLASGIWAFGSIKLLPGDGLDVPAGTSIVSGGSISITLDNGDADPGVGARAWFAGRLGGTLPSIFPAGSTYEIIVVGGPDTDTITVASGVVLGARTTVVAGSTDTVTTPAGGLSNLTVNLSGGAAGTSGVVSAGSVAPEGLSVTADGSGGTAVGSGPAATASATSSTGSGAASGGASAGATSTTGTSGGADFIDLAGLAADAQTDSSEPAPAPTPLPEDSSENSVPPRRRGTESEPGGPPE